jgi:hypothetical protein
MGCAPGDVRDGMSRAYQNPQDANRPDGRNDKIADEFIPLEPKQSCQRPAHQWARYTNQNIGQQTMIAVHCPLGDPTDQETDHQHAEKPTPTIPKISRRSIICLIPFGTVYSR